MPLDKNDLYYLIANIGSMCWFRTKPQPNAGANAIWDFQAIDEYSQSEENIIISTAKELTGKGMTIQCWDENSLHDHVVIGEWTFWLPQLWIENIASFLEPIEVTVTFINEKKWRSYTKLKNIYSQETVVIQQPDSNNKINTEILQNTYFFSSWNH